MQPFTYTVNGEKAEFPSKCGAKYIFDGNAMARMSEIASFDEGGSIKITMDQPTDVKCMYLYPSQYGEYAPDGCEVIINGQYVISGLKFRGDDGAPITVSFRYLPDGTLIESIEVVLHLKDGNSYAALAEIVMQTKK